MTDEQKRQLIERVEEYGVDRVLDLIGVEHVRRQGSNVFSVCPMHEGADNPTGFLYSNGYGYCFTHCHKAFDIYDIVMHVKGCNFGEAASFLAKLIGMDIDSDYKPAFKSDGKTNRDFLAAVKKSNILTPQTFAEYKALNPEVFESIVPKLHKRLREEGFDEDVRQYFGLGFGTDGYMQGRITIPVDAPDGSIVTIAGRSTLSADELNTTGERRYQLLYAIDKGSTLYNISRATPYIEICGEVIVVEGYKSVWRLHQWGIDNCVALMGTSISEHQRNLLLRTGATIVVCGDRDEAGANLNDAAAKTFRKFAQVELIDLFDVQVPLKSSIDNLTKLQYDYVYSHRKVV